MMPSDSSVENADTWSNASNPTFLRHLDRLRINVRGGTTHHPGSNPVPRATQDSGLEFAKHRPYTPGDDLRHIDWNALARHDTKLIKTFRAEREAPLHLLVDGSASMATPNTDGKMSAASATAISLAYISLRNRDPVRVALFDASGTRHIAPLVRHPQRLELLREGLREHSPNGPTDIDRGIDGYLGITRLPGIAVILSDFLVHSENYLSAFRKLRASGYAVAAIRIIGNQERTPKPPTRRVRLYDVESKQERIVDLSAKHLARYQAALDAHISQLQTHCKQQGIPFAVIDTSAAPSQAMTVVLTRAGILN